MGNASSNANQPHRTSLNPDSLIDPNRREASHSPSPGRPHHSLRTKKKSLELPDLVSLGFTPANPSSRQSRRHPTPPKTASIPIPTSPAGPRQPPPNQFSSTIDFALQPSTHRPIASRQATRQDTNPTPYSRGRQQTTAQQQHIQALYNQSQTPHVPAPPPSPNRNTGYSSSATPSSRPPFVQETVHSSIPIALGKALLVDDDVDGGVSDDPDVTVTVRITWRGGGTNVLLTRAGDQEWKGRMVMEKESPNSQVYHSIVHLRPGTHHIRFLVDGQSRVSEAYPSAVDDQGSLANYISISLVPPYIPTLPMFPPTPVPPSTPPGGPNIQSPQSHKLIPGQSFWSAASSADDDGTATTSGTLHNSNSNNRSTHAHTSSAPPQAHSHHHTQSQHNHRHGHGPVPPLWTSVIPQELVEAAREEEQYLAASEGVPTSTDAYGMSQGHIHVNGFVPAPNIPPAPGLPRHLDKLILNTRITSPGPVVGATTSSLGSPGLASGSAGGARSRKREGKERERREERERVGREEGREREEGRRRERREREGRMQPPPAPPPSEDGTGSGLNERPDPSPVRPDTVVEAVWDEKEVKPSGATSATTAASSTSTSAATTAPTTPIPSAAESPTTPFMNPSLPSPSLGPSLSSAQPNPTWLPPATLTSPSTKNPPAFLSSPPLPTLPASTSVPTGSRAIGIDTANMPAISDDSSVLPVPSHVVLHHLSTSAIKNGVLAVGNTTRYRKKYLTTVYYKPIELGPR